MEFESFATARLPALLRYATLLSGDPDEARDLVQEVLTRALVRWARVGRADEPYHYVHRMVTNEFLSRRRRRRFRLVPLSEDAAAVGPPERFDDGLWQSLGRLPARQRAVLVLRYYEGLTDAEIAEAIGCRPGTVRGYASRALATLRIDLAASEGVLS